MLPRRSLMDVLKDIMERYLLSESASSAES